MNRGWNRRFALRVWAVFAGLVLITVSIGKVVDPWLALLVPGTALAAVGLLAAMPDDHDDDDGGDA